MTAPVKVKTHQLATLAKAVDKTHPGSARLLCAQLLCARAKIAMLIVAPPGTGKSLTMRAVMSLFPDGKTYDSITLSGLQKKVKELTGFTSLVAVDDLGKVDTDYSRISTTTTFCELTYSHYTSKHSANVNVEIRDFYGSVILGVQPRVLKAIVASQEWESNIMDKTLRYYHLYRPWRPLNEPIILPDLPDVPLNMVKLDLSALPAMEKLGKLGLTQWSRSRVGEHTTRLLKAAASYDDRQEVTNADAELVFQILRPMIVEQYATVKEGLGGQRMLNDDLICLLVELASYGEIGIQDLAENYKVSHSSAYKILHQYDAWLEPVDGTDGTKLWRPRSDSPLGSNRPSMMDVLKSIGVTWLSRAEHERLQANAE